MATQKQSLAVTYEVLYDMLRNEKNRDELQELDPDFFSNVLQYLHEKHKILEESKHKQDLFSASERDKTVTQIKNIHRLLRELYERRESKIIVMALNRSRTNNGMIDASRLLKEEKSFYEALTGTLNQYRQDILVSLLERRPVSVFASAAKDFKPATEIKKSEQPRPEQSKPQPEGSAPQPPQASPTMPSQIPSSEQLPEHSTKTLKFLTSVPKFVGSELEEYGPYEPAEITDLPKDIAKVLIESGKAEEVLS